MNQKQKIPVSIVIPTLGGSSLLKVIKLLNESLKIPEEIIICIPKEQKYDNLIKNFENVKIIKTNIKGQVSQRIEGFKNATQEFILQLDDDCKISSNDIYNLMINLKELGEGNALAPIYFDENSGECSHKFKKGFKGLIKTIIATAICGAPWGIKRMGTISKIGTNYGVDINYMKSSLKEVEWVPGGCVMHYNSSTIKENFFPYKGKAFCEDLMHSYLLRQNNIKIWVTNKSSCITKHAFFPDQKHEVIQYLEAFKYFQKIRNKKILRFWIWYFINLLRIWIKFNIEKRKTDNISIGIELNHKSYLPEAYAYANFLKQKGFDVDLNYEGKLKNNNSIIIHFMGFRPFWNNIFNKHLEIHEYASLSTSPYAKIKDIFKYYFNTRPIGRIFMNKTIKSSLGFDDKIPFIYREMGADSNMYKVNKSNNKNKEFDLIYSGSIINRDGLIESIEKVADIGLKILLVGMYNDVIFERLKNFNNIKMIGRVDREKLPYYFSKCKAGLNFTPNIHPLKLQSSTKTIEYCAAGLGVISSKYDWVQNFEKNRAAKFMWLNDLNRKSDFEKFDFVIPDVSDLEWNQILEKSSFDTFIKKIYLNS